MRKLLQIFGLLLLGALAPSNTSAQLSIPGATLTPLDGEAFDEIYAGTQARDGYDRYDGYYDRQIRARLWVDGDRDYFRNGDRLRVRFNTSDDAYVALIHVDPDGRLDFLFPSSPWDRDYVRGGRTHSLSNAYRAGLPVRGRPGIGYLYLIASPVPLDYSAFSRSRGGPWDWSYAGRNVTGDPFWAFEQISRLLVPDYVPYATDYYSYYVDGRHRYPYYACNDRYRGTRGGWGWSSHYGSCANLNIFLTRHPYYYDARLYRGNRRAYIARTYGPPRVEHGFKESPRATPARAQDQIQLRAPQGQQARPQNGVTQSQGATGRSTAQPGQTRARPTPQATPAGRNQARPEASPQQSRPQATQERQRPTLERRTPQRSEGSSSGRSASPAPSRTPSASPAPSRTPSASPSPRRERPTPSATRGNNRGGNEARGTSSSARSGGNQSRDSRAPASRRGNNEV